VKITIRVYDQHDADGTAVEDADRRMGLARLTSPRRGPSDRTSASSWPSRTPVRDRRAARRDADAAIVTVVTEAGITSAVGRGDCHETIASAMITVTPPPTS
jgi:hypothetical protein